MDWGTFAGGAAVALVAGTGVTLAVVTSPAYATPRSPPPTDPPEAGLSSRATLEAFATVRDRRGHREYRALPPPSDDVSKVVKLLGMGSPTPLPAGTNTDTGEGLGRILVNVQQVLRAANRNEDPRCVWHLWQHETGSGRACWWNNWGNVKGRHWCFADEAMVRQGRAYSTSRYASGFWLAQGRQESHVEAYLAFPDVVTWARFERAFLGAKYPDAIRGYERGGLEGLKQSARALARGGYSGATEITRVLRAERYWARGQELMGAQLWNAMGARS